MGVKATVHDVAEKLPDDATYEDAMYALYVRMKFEQGKRDIDEGRFLTTDEAKKKLLRWRV
ncbi:MAG: hypothetical protein JSR44_00580 [Spirochaetes bacterium]|nr:hypothetical protein [Spirochaetota bacterium]